MKQVQNLTWQPHVVKNTEHLVFDDRLIVHVQSRQLVGSVEIVEKVSCCKHLAAENVVARFALVKGRVFLVDVCKSQFFRKIYFEDQLEFGGRWRGGLIE